MTLRDEITPDIRPGNDFYGFVNEKWLKANPLPDNKALYGAFSVLDDSNTEKLKSILESDERSESENVEKLKLFYRSAMDIETIEKNGLSAVDQLLSDIKSISDAQGLWRFIAQSHARGFGLIWRNTIEIDDKDSSRYIYRINQAGLGLPDRDYYLEPTPQFSSVRDKYKQFLVDFFTLMKVGDPDRRAEDVIALESKLAEASFSGVENRDVENLYNLYTTEKLASEFPGFKWQSYSEATGLTAVRNLLVSQPKFLKKAVSLLDQPISKWESYLLFHTLLPLLKRLPKGYEQLHFDFYGRVLEGRPEPELRYREIINLCQRLLPEPTGQAFVSAQFDEIAKKEVSDLVEHLTTALRNRIKGLDWMSATTKQKALEKLDSFVPLLGYPDVWRDYSGLSLSENFAENFMAIMQNEWNFDLGRLSRPVDRKEWAMSPAAVNAYCWFNTNTITFPAGILQPPFFDAGGDFAANYGGIGAVIGHELTHHFDDMGAVFDANGNIGSWWTEEDKAAFDNKAQKLAKQYDSYKVGDMHVKGELTLGENIADLGGVLIAYDAMMHKIDELGATAKIDGYTPQQRFFLSHARIWRRNVRPELALQRVVTDPHSPAEYRVNGVVTNCDPFYEAFDCRPGDTLYQTPDKRVRIW